MNVDHRSPTKLETTQILVVGAGPVGLFAALCAARRGLDVMLLEQNARGHATLLHPCVVEVAVERASRVNAFEPRFDCGLAS